MGIRLLSHFLPVLWWVIHKTTLKSLQSLDFEKTTIYRQKFFTKNNAVSLFFVSLKTGAKIKPLFEAIFSLYSVNPFTPTEKGSCSTLGSAIPRGYGTRFRAMRWAFLCGFFGNRFCTLLQIHGSFVQKKFSTPSFRLYLAIKSQI